MNDHASIDGGPLNGGSSGNGTQGDDALRPGHRRKPYQKPELVQLGSLSDVTRTTSYFGQSDGGRFPKGYRTGN